MKLKIILKSVYLVVLVLIVISLSYFMISGSININKLHELNDYKILVNGNCINGEELIYSDKKYDYYLPCINSYNIYLEWKSGEVDLLKDALKSKVDIASLTSHGLEVVKYERKD